MGRYLVHTCRCILELRLMCLACAVCSRYAVASHRYLLVPDALPRARTFACKEDVSARSLVPAKRALVNKKVDRRGKQIPRFYCQRCASAAVIGVRSQGRYSEFACLAKTDQFAILQYIINQAAERLLTAIAQVDSVYVSDCNRCLLRTHPHLSPACAPRCACKSTGTLNSQPPLYRMIMVGPSVRTVYSPRGCGKCARAEGHRVLHL